MGKDKTIAERLADMHKKREMERQAAIAKKSAAEALLKSTEWLKKK